MTELIQARWKKIYEHDAYLPLVKWHQEEWNEVEINSTSTVEKANWCCENIKGFFSIRRENNFGQTRIFYFYREEDAVAFKLMWI